MEIELPPTQTSYQGVTDTCSRCNGPAGSRAVQLSGGASGRPRYLCQSCADIRAALDALKKGDPLWLDSASAKIDQLENVLNSIFVLAWDNPPIIINQVFEEHRKVIDQLRCLVREAESQQPWD